MVEKLDFEHGEVKTNQEVEKSVNLLTHQVSESLQKISGRLETSLEKSVATWKILCNKWILCSMRSRQHYNKHKILLALWDRQEVILINY